MVDNDILIVVSIRSLDQESNIKIPDTLILILILTAIRNSLTQPDLSFFIFYFSNSQNSPQFKVPAGVQSSRVIFF